MILSDKTILQEIEQGNIIIEPFERELLNPNSVDLRLGNELKIYQRYFAEVDDRHDLPTWVSWNCPNTKPIYPNSPIWQYELPLDIKEKPETITIEMTEEGFVLYPNEVYLYACKERIGVKGNICAQVMAKSSLGRLGLDIVVGPAGFIDSGFEGSLVLELRATRPIRIYPYMKIAQIKYERVEGEILESYDKKAGSKYMNQVGVQASLMAENFKNENNG